MLNPFFFFSFSSPTCTTTTVSGQQTQQQIRPYYSTLYGYYSLYGFNIWMRRHWQHTSFCMGQCVSSCGSKRTLDSVPTTPDTENYPGLISTSTSSLRSVSKASSFALVAHEQPVPLVLSTSSDLHQQPSPQKSSRSPAAKFVTAFAQKKVNSSTLK